MSSFVAKHVVKHVTKKVGCSEKKVDKLGRIAKWSTAIATGDVIGVIADRAWTKYKENKEYEQRYPDELHDYDSDGDEEREVEGIDNEGHHKELASIQPFLNMAMEAYSDTSMEDRFGFVKRSQLIRDLKEPTKLGWGITTDTEVHVCILEDGTLAFAFRGTELIDWKSPLGDILTDLKQNQVPLEYYDASDIVAYEARPSVRVHEGFKLAFQDVTKTSRQNENLRLVAEGLGAKEADVRRVVCIGHSLGGALATLCAHWCRHIAYPKARIWCVTTGSPRVGNRAFASDFNENVTKSYRVVNKGDVVPSIPNIGTYLKLWSAYKHVGGPIYFSEHPTRKDTISLKRGGRRPLLVLLSLIDHSCDAYFNSIDTVLASFYKYGPHRLITLPPIN